MGQGVEVHRLPVRFEEDDDAVIALPCFPGGAARVRAVFQRFADLSDANVERLFNQVSERFDHRHQDIEGTLEEHYDLASSMAGFRDPLCVSRRRLLGSCFTMEYSYAWAALFNPSIVPHPYQEGEPAGGLRFIMSLRATGEGHVSSIVFRMGVLLSDQEVRFHPPGPHPRRVRLSPDQFYVKSLFRRKLRDLAINQLAVDEVMSRLADRFTLLELKTAVSDARRVRPEAMQLEETIEGIRWLARENYQLRLPDDADISQLVIFPQSDNENRGIEEWRMVRFVDDDGSVTYYGTYSACGGCRVLPPLRGVGARPVALHA